MILIQVGIRPNSRSVRGDLIATRHRRDNEIRSVVWCSVDTGTLVKSFQVFHTDNKSLSEPVDRLKTIFIQAVLWQFPRFAFPDALGLQAC